MSVTVLYFASLRDAAGVASEIVPVPTCAAILYEELRVRHGFPAFQNLRVAINGEFARWDVEVPDGAEIAFIPPVSGG